MIPRKEVEKLQLTVSRLVGGTSAGRKINDEFESLLSKPGPDSKAKAAETSLEDLKKEYEDVTGNKPGRRKAETMREEIDQIND
jgi:hypothetical protein